MNANVPYDSPCSKVPIASTGVVTGAENAWFREGILPVVVCQFGLGEKPFRATIHSAERCLPQL
jgi:hypothetical protein